MGKENERFKEVIGDIGTSQAAIAKELGLSASAITYYCGERKIPKSTLLALSALYNVNPDYVKYGVGAKFSNDFTGAIKTLYPNPGAPSPIPILGDISAGGLQQAFEQPEEWLKLEMVIPDPDNHFCIRVVGEAMSGAGIVDGDLVICRRFNGGDAVKSGQIYALAYKGDVIFKRLFVHSSNYELKSENPAYQAFFVPKTDVQVIGVMVSLFRVFGG